MTSLIGACASRTVVVSGRLGERARVRGMIDIGLIAPDLELREDGIWYSRDQRSVSYPVDGHAGCFALEDSSFWFAHRNRCIVAAVKTFPPPEGGAIFDIGGGNGFVARGLLDAGFDAVLLEPGVAGAHNAQKRGVQNIICATTETARIRSDSIPAAGLFDVIEHIENDVGFLRSLRSNVKRGGHLYATVPAFNVLWAKEDVMAGHFRRYTRGGICKAIADAGFDILFSSYIFRPLPLPIFLFRVLPHWLRLDLTKAQNKDQREHGGSSGRAARMLDRVLQAEVRNIMANKPMRFGASCLVVARAA